MLADEMTIVTRPVGPDGRPAEKALRVEIPVSGSLFRVREDDERGGTALPGGGTRVRLHLRRAGALPGNSAVSVLRSLVLFSEFRLEVRDQDGTEETWLPGRLNSGEEPGSFSTRFAVEAVPGTLWWVSGDGAIVCDGIATDKQTFGYVLICRARTPANSVSTARSLSDTTSAGPRSSSRGVPKRSPQVRG